MSLVFLRDIKNYERAFCDHKGNRRTSYFVLAKGFCDVVVIVIGALGEDTCSRLVEVCVGLMKLFFDNVEKY